MINLKLVTLNINIHTGKDTVYVYMWYIFYCYQLFQATPQNTHRERNSDIDKLSNVSAHLK